MLDLWISPHMLNKNSPLKTNLWHDVNGCWFFIVVLVLHAMLELKALQIKIVYGSHTLYLISLAYVLVHESNSNSHHHGYTLHAGLLLTTEACCSCSARAWVVMNKHNVYAITWHKFIATHHQHVSWVAPQELFTSSATEAVIDLHARRPLSSCSTAVFNSMHENKALVSNPWLKVQVLRQQ